MQIQWTKVLDQVEEKATVEMLFADAPTPEDATEYLLLRVKVAIADENRSKQRVPLFAELQKAALVRLRELTKDQSQALSALLGDR